jgi:hypothetical protein
MRSFLALLILAPSILCCGEEGMSMHPSCPELPLYDINQPLSDRDRAIVEQASTQTRLGRCTTPIGTASTDGTRTSSSSRLERAIDAGAGDPDAGVDDLD